MGKPGRLPKHTAIRSASEVPVCPDQFWLMASQPAIPEVTGWLLDDPTNRRPVCREAPMLQCVRSFEAPFHPNVTLHPFENLDISPTLA